MFRKKVQQESPRGLVVSKSTMEKIRKAQEGFFENNEKSAPVNDADRHSIYIVGTGGTIAGKAKSSTHANYTPSEMGAADIMETVPELSQFPETIRSLDALSVDSEDMTPQNWLKLAKKVNVLLEDEDTKGVVITHGTDTIEETAYFLDLVVKSDKPVVIVGAMRASTAMSADGPMNLYNAIAVIHSPDAVGQGVMVMMNDTIYDARNVTKTNTTNVDTFKAPNGGPIGRVNFGNVRFDHKAMRKHTTETPFDISDLEELPYVGIAYEFAGCRGTALKALVADGAQGVVIAGTGDGSLSAPDRSFIKYAREKGVQIVRSSRTGSGCVTSNPGKYETGEMGTISADNLNPQKARILLMLSLTQENHLVKDIQRNFGTY